MDKSSKKELTRVFVAISLLLLLVAFILEFISLFFGVSDAFSSAVAFGAFAVTEIIRVIVILFILALLLVTYATVWKRVGWKKYGARDMAIILAVVEIIVGLVLSADFVLLAGVMLLVAWIVMIS
ncbi:MAG: hypothetical protein M1148_02725 [Candidatus Thermoplasmatota archaeon]|nr:hypothetical protein [Candidatus Thermoplasmatota archaeon]